jgi:anaerobic nitric oxide reductase transcription regulator
VLVPVAARGLSEDALGRRFQVAEHPRLEVICRSEDPVRFPAVSPLPDPFDGLLSGVRGEHQRIHACLGWPLRVDGLLIGTLTADALAPEAFDRIEQRFLVALGALASAALRTTDLLDALERSAERQGQIAQDLMRDVQLRRGSDLLGTSTAMRRLRQEIDIVGATELSVLITGETGAGKELVARAGHAASERRAAPMLYVNCAALPDTLAESELFGHVRGAFTGATTDRPGKFEIAGGGTLFLDEIGELSQSVQPKLLRVLQEGEVQRVGTEKTIQVDVRVLTATNRDLQRDVAEDEGGGPGVPALSHPPGPRPDPGQLGRRRARAGHQPQQPAPPRNTLGPQVTARATTAPPSGRRSASAVRGARISRPRADDVNDFWPVSKSPTRT